MPDLFPNEEWKPYAGPDGAVFRLPDSVAKNIPGLVPAPSAEPMNQVDYGNAGGDGHAFGYTYDPKNLPAIPAGEGPPIDYDPNDTSNMVPIGAPQIAGVGASPATKQRLASNLGPKNTGVLNLQQATGPVGTIGQINQPLASPAAAGGYATQADFDAATSPPADAVSGAGTAAQQQATEPAPLTADTLRDMGPAGVANQQQAALADEADAARAAADTQAKYQLQIADATVKRNEEIDKQIAERAKAAEDQSRRIDARMTEYDAAAKKYADFKPDRSIDHPILAAISVALGAIGGVIKNDGTNPALDMLMKQIDRKAQLQMQDLGRLKDVAAGKRGDIDLLRQRASDKTAQYNLAIAGETEKAARQMEAIAARLTSETAKQDAAIKIAQLRQRAAAAVGDAVGAQMAKDERDRAFEEQKRATGVQERNERSRIGLAYQQFGFERLKWDDQKKLQLAGLNLEAQKLTQAGQANIAKQVVERGIGGVATIAKNADGSVQADADGNPVVRQDILRNRDGSVFIPQGSAASVDKLRDAKAATDTLVQLMDEAQRLRTGWTSDTANSAEWQQLKANWAAAKGVAKDVLGLGALSGPDMELVDKFLGTSDPTSFKDPSAGISKARANVVTILNSRLRAAGLDGEYDPPNLSQLRNPTATVDEQAFKQVLGDPRRQAVSYGDAFPDLKDDINAGGQRGSIAAQKAQHRLTAGELTSFQKQTLDTYAAALDGSGKQRELALSYLKQAEKSAQSQAVKEYASQILALGQATANVPTSREPIDVPSASVARDTSAGGPAQTMSEQKQNDAAKASVVRSMPLARIVEGAQAGDVPSRQELARRAGAGDKQAQKAALQIIQTKVR